MSDEILTINCIFEALPSGSQPAVYRTSHELPRDQTREEDVPIQLNGWDPGIGWAMIEAFDISIIFPVGYAPVFELDHSVEGNHDPTTTDLLAEVLEADIKPCFISQWQILQGIRHIALENLPQVQNTRSRYRIGLLHVYLFYRLVQRVAHDRAPSLEDFVSTLVETTNDRVQVNRLATQPAFAVMELEQLVQVFEQLAQIYVRKGKNAKTFCTLQTFSNPIADATVYRAKFNPDFQLCMQDLREHIQDSRFASSIYRSFERFDQTFGIEEALDDLADPALVSAKEAFVRAHFLGALEDEDALNEQLQLHAKVLSEERLEISEHQQNWVFEMLLYITGLNSAEDIQKRFKANFERSGHRVRPHAPYGDHAKLVAFLLQGRDICEQWSDFSRRRTLSAEEFRTLSWRTIAQCIIQGFRDENQMIYPPEVVIQKYQGNKSMRVISSDLNGFYIMVEHFLGDICYLQFTEDTSDYPEELKPRICPSWQTDVINTIWNGRPLETWMEGVSRNGQWLIKVQSSQDGNEGHKTKELAGRCRALRLAWSHGTDPRNRDEWSFSLRPLPKLALVLDGDWDVTKKRNLYEAGWDWVGDVSQLQELRQLIQPS